MNENLPNDFDIIVIGTGLCESIIAAAASRVGKKVLHVDKNDYYGGSWASFNLEGIEKFINDCQRVDNDSNENGNNTSVATNTNSFLKYFSHDWHVPDKIELLSEALQECKLTQTPSEESGKTIDSTVSNEDCEIDSSEKETIGEMRQIQNEQWSKEKLLKESRKFSLDLTPKLLYSRGSLVEVLISSNIARYAEFRNCSRVLTWIDGNLQEVPCSRADIFATKQVTVVEKRILMKLVNDVLDEGKNYDNEEFNEITFNEFLTNYRLTPNIKHYVLYTMASSIDSTPFQDGLKRMRKFLNSLGRYGNSPFLWTMYGSGEMPQCFCRLCAVFGGIYCLNRPIKSLLVNSENICNGIVIGDQEINTPLVVMSVELAPEKYLPDPLERRNISHAIFIIDRSIKDCDKENLTYLRFPPLKGQHPCNIIEVGPAASACPKNLYVLYMYTIQETNPKDDLEPYVNKLINTSVTVSTASKSTQTSSSQISDTAVNLPQALWSFYYTIPDFSLTNLQNNNVLPKNVHLCFGPDHEIDYEFAVEQARYLFNNIYPNDEFLPRAPDPDEIVLEGEEAEEIVENMDAGASGDNSPGTDVGDEAVEDMIQ